MRQRWVLSLAFFAALTAALVLVLQVVNGTPGANLDHNADVRANEQGQAVVAADQALRAVVLLRRSGPRGSLEHAIADDVRARLAARTLTGTLGAVRCTPAASARRGQPRLTYRCRAATDGFSYPFRGVVDSGARRVFFCKQDDAVSAGLQVALDPRCLR